MTGDLLSFSDLPRARAIWLFTADLDDAAFTRLSQPTEPWPLAQALGVPGLDPARVETFFAEDIEDYGLARYLGEAHGVDAPDIAADAAWLDALTGPIVLVFAQGLPEGAGRFAPRAPLRFLARYGDSDHLLPANAYSPGASTRGHIPAPKGPPTDYARLRRLLLITLAVLLGLAGLVWALAWTG